MLWPEKNQNLRSPIFCVLIRCARPCSNCIVIFSVVYYLHSVTPFKRAAKPHRQQRLCYQPPLRPHQKSVFLLIACAIARSCTLSSGCCFPCWPIKAQEMGTARAGRLPSVSLRRRLITSRHHRFVCISEKSASSVDVMRVEFNFQLFISMYPCFFAPSPFVACTTGYDEVQCNFPKIAHDGVGEILLKIKTMSDTWHLLFCVSQNDSP